MEVREYLDDEGRNPYALWFSGLSDEQAVARILVARARMEDGNLGDSHSIGKGVMERRIHYGPGYRIYYGREDDKIVILLGGGTKKRQSRDVAEAQALWARHKADRRKDEQKRGSHG